MLTREQIHPIDLQHCYDPKKFDWEKEYYSKYTVAKNLNPKLIVEIGVRAGYSAYSFLSACPKTKYIGYDIWQGEYSKLPQIVAKAWAEQILKPFNAQLYVKDTQLVRALSEVGVYDKVELAHIDGDHSYYGTLHDLRLVSRSTFATHMLIDDTSFIEDVLRAVKCFVEWDKEYELLYEIDSPRGAWLLKRKESIPLLPYGDGTAYDEIRRD